MNRGRIELMVVGAQKAGTTSLSNYLGEHPLLLNPLCMEFTFFTDPKEQEKGIDQFMDRYYPSSVAEGIRLIAKMSSLYRFRSALEQLKQYNPQCHLALIVRDPVQRAYSAYRMACYDGWLKFDPDFMASLLRQGKPGEELFDMFVGYGYYADALEEIWNHFPREQLHLFRFEDLKRDPQAVCDALFQQLGVPPHTLRAKDKVHNETVQARSNALAGAIHWLRLERNPIKRLVRSMLPYPVYLRFAGNVQDLNKSQRPFPPMESGAKAQWGAHYRDHDRRLAQMLGLDLSGWTSQRN
jgi:Sulfotransferase domain